MFKRSAISLVLSLATTFASVARADEAAIREELENIAGMQLQAYRRKDVKAYMKYLAPDYSTTILDGFTSNPPRRLLEREILSDMENTVSIGFVIRDIKELKLESGKILVVVSQKSSRIQKDGDSRHKWETCVVQREGWIKTNEGLKISSIRTLEVIYVKRDGKLIMGPEEKPAPMLNKPRRPTRLSV